MGGAGARSSYATPPRLSRERDFFVTESEIVLTCMMDCQVVLFHLVVFSCSCELPTVVLKVVSVT